MRLVLVCLVLFVVPAASLLVAERQIGRIEADFFLQASGPIHDVEYWMGLYPPKLQHLPNVAAILRLRRFRVAHDLTEHVCQSRDTQYEPLFSHMVLRCHRWDRLRLAWWVAVGAILSACAVLVVILLAKIKVKRFRPTIWSQSLTLWFLHRGVRLPAILQAALSLLSPFLLIRFETGSNELAWAVAAIGLVPLSWAAAKSVSAFVDPRGLHAVSGWMGPKRSPAIRSSETHHSG